MNGRHARATYPGWLGSRGYSHETIRHALTLWLGGYSVAHVAQACGLSSSVVYGWLQAWDRYPECLVGRIMRGEA